MKLKEFNSTYKPKNISKYFKGIKKGDYYLNLNTRSEWYNQVVLCLGFTSAKKERQFLKEDIMWSKGGREFLGTINECLYAITDTTKYKVLTDEELALMKLKR